MANARLSFRASGVHQIEGGYALYEAAASGDHEQLATLLTADHGLLSRQRCDKAQEAIGMLLLVACSHGSKSCVKVLLHHAFDATITEPHRRSQQTVLHYAAAAGSTCVLALLLLRLLHHPARAAMLEHVDETGKSALGAPMIAPKSAPIAHAQCMSQGPTRAHSRPA